jgi:hypothetical protein
MGRPSEFTPETANELCERIISSESLKTICGDDHMPSESTVRNWLTRGSLGEEPFDAFLRQYTHAREAQADTDADAIGDIGRMTLAGGYDPQAARVAIDALKWSAGKRAPKKYGEKITQEHTGPNGSALPVIQVEFVSKRADPNT